MTTNVAGMVNGLGDMVEGGVTLIWPIVVGIFLAVMAIRYGPKIARMIGSAFGK